jgi:hypothetical protein
MKIDPPHKLLAKPGFKLIEVEVSYQYTVEKTISSTR